MNIRVSPASILVSLFLPVLAASCSSSLGDVPFDVMAEGVVEPLPCASPGDLRIVDRCSPHPLVGQVSALEVLELLDDAASAALGVERVWTGTIIGVGIDRDGRNLDEGLSGWSTSWVAGAAGDPDMLVFDATAGVCRVQNRCSCVSGGTCPGFDDSDVDGAQFPAVDSGVAIAAAFPDDDASARYDLSWDPATATWTVNHAAVVVSVDAVTADVTDGADVSEPADSTAD